MNKLITFLLVFLLIACQKMELIDQPTEQVTLKSAKVNKENQIIVKFKDNIKPQNVGQIKKQFYGLTVIKVPDVDKALEKLSNDPNVIYAEPDYPIQHCGFPNDSVYQTGTLWNMYSDVSIPTNQYGCGAINQWVKGNTGSDDVYVGIIDQGYFYNHPDLKDNAGVNPWEIAGNGIDDDSNGYIDDIHGWDFFHNDNTVFDGNSDYHGTHVAGIIGAVGNNNIGVAGVCWKVKLLSGKFLGPNGGWTSAAVEAIYYMIALKNKGLNIVALNNSWGGGDRSRALQQSIEDAGDVGILMICAAGNNGSNKVLFPAGYHCRNIISVASINKSGGLSSWSTWNRNLVDLAAPGEDIASTYYYCSPGWLYMLYAHLSGTSMATPHVTGAVALYASTHPGATAAQIKAAILDNTISTPSLVGKVKTGGRLDVSNL